MTPADRLLARLEGVQKAGPNRWKARCPSHHDRSPSLSICEQRDGKVWLHDFGGCAYGDVLAAVGLKPCDLFPDRPGYDFAPGRSRISARDLLEVIDLEVLTVGMIALQLRETRQLSDEDWTRLSTAAARIGRARDHAHGR
jgi:hypothetical protein